MIVECGNHDQDPGSGRCLPLSFSNRNAVKVAGSPTAGTQLDLYGMEIRIMAYERVSVLRLTRS